MFCRFCGVRAGSVNNNGLERSPEGELSAICEVKGYACDFFGDKGEFDLSITQIREMAAPKGEYTFTCVLEEGGDSLMYQCNGVRKSEEGPLPPFLHSLEWGADDGAEDICGKFVQEIESRE